jgi:hypothetical protein
VQRLTADGAVVNVVGVSLHSGNYNGGGSGGGSAHGAGTAAKLQLTERTLGLKCYIHNRAWEDGWMGMVERLAAARVEAAHTFSYVFIRFHTCSYVFTAP